MSDNTAKEDGIPIQEPGEINEYGGQVKLRIPKSMRNQYRWNGTTVENENGGKGCIKVFLYILLTAVVLFVGLLAIFLVSVTGIGDFYVGDFYIPVIMISVICILVFMFLHLFHFVTSKKMKRIWLIFLSLIMVSCAIYESRNAYYRSISRIRESDVDLSLYASCAENTQAAALDTVSLLRSMSTG